MLQSGISLLMIRKELKELTLGGRSDTETSVLQRRHSLKGQKQSNEGKVGPGI